MRVKSRFGIRIALVALMIFALSLPLFGNENNGLPSYNIVTAQGNNSKQVVLIDLNVQIDAGSSGLISRGIQTAENVKAAAVVIVMNTPGGLVLDAISIIDSINDSSVPVYTYVPNDSLAASAGSYIAMATVKIFMGPGSQIGPSTPEVVGGTALEENHTTDIILTLLQGLTQKNGRNTSATFNMVVNDIGYTYSEALAYHVADYSSNSLSQTLSILGLSGASTITVSENFSEQLVSFLSDPTVDGILLIIGIIAIVLDFLHPTILLSIAGAVLIALALIGEEVIQGPSPNPSFVAIPIILFALAGTMIVLELKTGHGFFLFGGVLVGAVATIFLAYEIPYSPSPFGDLQYIEIAVLVSVGALFAIYARWVAGTIRKKPYTGAEGIIGKKGIVYSDLSPDGEVTVDAVTWKARLVSPEIGPLPKGSSVVVKGISGLTISVEPEGIKEKARVS